jgi:hypothetical protein
MSENNIKSPKPQFLKAGDRVVKPAKAKLSDTPKGTRAKAHSTKPHEGPLKPGVKKAASDYVIVTPPLTIDPHRGSNILFFVVSIVVLVIGVYAAWPVWSPYVAEQFPALEYKSAVDPRVASLVGRLDALEAQTNSVMAKSATISDMENERARLQGKVGQLLKRLDSIEKTIVGVKVLVKAINDDGTIGETKRALDQITRRLAELERGGLDFGDLNNRLNLLETKSTQGPYSTIDKMTDTNEKITSLIGGLEGRIHSLEVTGHSSSTTRANSAAIILAVNQIRKSYLTGKPFNKDIDVLVALSKDHPDILAGLSILEKPAKRGVATIAILRAEFYKRSSTIINVRNESLENNWLKSTKNRLWALISIRKTSIELNEVSVDSFVAQIEKHLLHGRLVEAVQIASKIKSISEPAAKTVEPWLKAAKNRLVVERAIASIHVYAVSLMGHGKK